MAVWQFSVDFVPEQHLLETYGCIPDTLSPGAREKGGYFQSVALPVSDLLPYLERLGTLSEDSWSGTKYYHGEEDNDATVWFKEKTGQVQMLGCRIDLRQPSEPFLHAILLLATAFRCRLLIWSGQLIEPTAFSLVQAIEQSHTQRFVDDPLKFLDDLSKGSIPGLTASND